MRYLRPLYAQVALGMVLGIVVGLLWPDVAVQCKPLADGFIKLIKMLVAPIIFGTVVMGVAQSRDLGHLGRLGAKALIYFEVVSSLAILVGLLAAHIVQPGAGLHLDVATLDPSIAAGYVQRAAGHSWSERLLALIPDNLLAVLVGNDFLQVLLVAVLCGSVCTRIGSAGQRITAVIDDLLKLLFGVMNWVVRLAPLGAFGGMAFTIGRFGLATLWKLALLVLSLYGASLVFVALVLGPIAYWCGCGIWPLLRYLREEVLIVLSTSSTEAVFPALVTKLKQLGASSSVVGVVLPAGYSFNLDGSCIYITLAALFLAQATGTHLDWTQQLVLFGVASLTSKGTSGVAGVGFITLAATLAAVPSIPIESLAILVGIDRVLSVCRAVTSLIGNVVATLAVARWENELDRTALRTELGERQIG